MAKLAVFDQFYLSLEHSVLDVVRPALALERGAHEVVTYETAVRNAALGIAAIKKGDIAMPDIVIVGGRLEGEARYLMNPPTITGIADVPGRTWRGRPKVTQKRVTTTLLPVPDQMGNMALPATHNSPISKRRAEEHAEWLHEHFADQGRTGYILSHLTRLLLPDTIKIIGISSRSAMEDLPVDAFIERTVDAPDLLLTTINQLAD